MTLFVDTVLSVVWGLRDDKERNTCYDHIITPLLSQASKTKFSSSFFFLSVLTFHQILKVCEHG